MVCCILEGFFSLSFFFKTYIYIQSILCSAISSLPMFPCG